MSPRAWAQAMRVLLITDGQGERSRLVRIVEAALAGGVRAVQVREPCMSQQELQDTLLVLRGKLDEVEGLLFVNSDHELAARCGCDGVQVTRRSASLAHVRRELPRALVGASVHGQAELQAAAQAGADFAVLSPVWPTASKPDVMPLEPCEAGRLTRQAGLPVVWLGGCTPERTAAVRDLPAAHRPLGFAAIRALCADTDPKGAARAFVAAATRALDAAPGMGHGRR